jgi:hypothetical protein
MDKAALSGLTPTVHMSWPKANVELPGFRAFQFHNGFDRVRDPFRVSAARMAEMERKHVKHMTAP